MIYQRTIKVYKGVDNKIRFTFKNADQKPVNITGYDVKFNLISDLEGSILLSLPTTVVDAVTGVLTVTLTEFDLIDLTDEYYSYSLSVIERATGQEQVVYTDDNYTARGNIQLLSGHYPTFKKSIEVLLPTNSNAVIFSSLVSADQNSRQQSAHHTAQFYFDTFTGNIAVQTTLDNLPPNGNTSGNISWSTATTIQYIAQEESTYQNFDGVISAVRFVITPDNSASGKVTKILYRG